MAVNRKKMKNLLLEAEQTLDNFNGSQVENRYDDEDGYDDEGYDDEGYDDEGYDDEGYDDESFSGSSAVRSKISPNDRTVLLIVTNATGGATVETVDLLGSFDNPITSLPSGITVQAPLNGGYARILEAIKTNTAKVKGLRIDYSNASDASFPIETLNKTGYGKRGGEIILPSNYVDNYAQNEKIINIPDFDFILSGDDTFRIQIPDGATIKYSFYITSRNDQSNAHNH